MVPSKALFMSDSVLSLGVVRRSGALVVHFTKFGSLCAFHVVYFLPFGNLMLLPLGDIFTNLTLFCNWINCKCMVSSHPPAFVR